MRYCSEGIAVTSVLDLYLFAFLLAFSRTLVARDMIAIMRTGSDYDNTATDSDVTLEMLRYYSHN